MVAAYRARASAAESPLIEDPHARALAGDEGMELARRMDAAGQPHLELWIALRTAFLDDRIDRWTLPRGPAAQVVILGAGLDTRAARLAREGVRFFEVDRPETQAEKHARLARLAGYPTGAATYVACNFEHDDFLDRLVAGGFDPAAPAVVIWEGVTPYLSERAVRATLRRIATGMDPRTVVLYDFLGRKIVEGDLKHAEDLETRGLVRDLGEPLTWGTNDVLPLLYEEGFRSVRVTSFDEIALARTGTYERARKWRFQWIAECSVGRLHASERST
jgi:methyltransferase (TIGR00027 family)